MSHSHNHHARTDSKLLGRAFFLIAGFMVVELVAGIATNALVLIADAGHMFLDATALGLSWWAASISARGFDHKLSYGYHRFQVLAAFTNGLTLVALIIWIAFEAVTRLASPEQMSSEIAFVVATIGFVINIIAFKWLHDASNSANVRSAALHVLGDLLGSVAAMLAAAAVFFFGWLYADPILALLIAVILSRGAYRIIKESAHILLEGVPDGVDLAEIKQVLSHTVPGVVGVHHVHAWALTDQKPLLTLHAQVEEKAHVHDIVSQIKNVLTNKFGIDHSTIQIEHGSCPDDDDGHRHA